MKSSFQGQGIKLIYQLNTTLNGLTIPKDSEAQKQQKGAGDLPLCVFVRVSRETEKSFPVREKDSPPSSLGSVKRPV